MKNFEEKSIKNSTEPKFVEGFLEQALKFLETQNQINLQNLDSFLNSFSMKIDQAILDIEKKEHLVYRAGNGILKALPNNKMQLEANLYFQNYQDKWINKTCISPQMDMSVFLENISIEELNRIQEYKFSISDPKS